MVHRVAIVVSIAAAAGVLIVSMAVAGLRPGTTEPAAAAAPVAGIELTPTAKPTPIVKTVTDTVYVKPVPTPRIIHITKPAVERAPAPTLKPKVIVRHVPSRGHGGEPGDDGEGGDRGEGDD
jgi:hypothetical protein